MIIPVVPVDGFCYHLFARNQVLPFLFRLETPERRVVGVFVLENLLATFFVVAGIEIVPSTFGTSPARIAIRTLIRVALGID